MSKLFSSIVVPQKSYREALILPKKPIILKADTGATGHYIKPSDMTILNNLLPTTTGPAVRLPNNEIMQAKLKGNLPLPTLPSTSTKAHVFQELQSASLLSVGQLCDSDCDAVFSKHDLKIYDNKKRIILRGARNFTDGLWDVKLNIPQQTSVQHTVNAVLKIDKTSKKDLAQYLHACAYSPRKTTFLDAIKKGLFTTWPGLTYDLIKKHLPDTIATSKGHLRQEQKNIRSTQIKVEDEPKIVLDYHPLPEEDNTKTHECYLTYFVKEEGVTYSDLAGTYPTKSSRGNQYIIICYDYDTNSIQAQLTKSRNAADIRDATLKMIEQLQRSGHPPKLHIMDNEASAIIKAALLKHKVKYQLVPPHLHRRNSAERAIQTFKAHFIAGLCSTDPEYPAAEWDRLVPQAELTLNLLRSCRFNPKLSAYAALHGMFDFNATPLVPPGTKVLLHEKPDVRRTWAPRGTDAWYIGPALEHYRCVECYMPETRSTRIADTLEYFPAQIPFPKSTTEDYLRQSISDILAILNVKIVRVRNPNDRASSKVESCYVTLIH